MLPGRPIYMIHAVSVRASDPTSKRDRLTFGGGHQPGQLDDLHPL